MRNARAKKLPITPDPKFKSELVTKFVNSLMYQGKKSIAFSIFYNALGIIEEKTGQDGLEVFQNAIKNVMPAVEVKSRRVGGATFQVPTEVRPERQQALGIRWLIKYTRARNGRSMEEKLSAIRAVSRIPAPEVAAHLERAMSDPSEEVRATVVACSHQLFYADRLRLLRLGAVDSSLNVQLTVVNSISWIYERKASPIFFLNQLDQEPDSPCSRLTASPHFSAILRHVSTSSDSELAQVLGDSLSESHRDLLKALLADPELRVRLQACRWTLKNQHLADFKVILGLFENDDDYGVRALAAKVLGEMGDARALETLEKVFFDKELTWYADNFLFHYHLFPRYRAPDDVLPLRISVALAITKLDPQKGVPLLRPYLDHPDPRVSQAALQGMDNSMYRSSPVLLSE